MARKDEKIPLASNLTEDGRMNVSDASQSMSDKTNGNKCCPCLSKTSHLPISIPISIHVTLSTLALITTRENSWPPVYFFSNIVMVLASVWTARELDKIQPVILYMYTILLSAVVDSILLGAFFPRFNERTLGGDPLDRGIFLLSSVSMIAHLAMKPVILIYLIIVVIQRCQ